MRTLALFLLGLAACGSPEPVRAPDGGPVAKKPKEPPKGIRFPAEMKTHRWVMHVQPCGQKCQLIHRGYSSAQVSFGTNGKVSLQDQGEVRERFRASHGKRTARTKWTRSFSGSWTLGPETLHLTFAIANDTCERVEGEANKDCSPAPNSFELDCLRREVKLSRPKRRMAWSWVCDNPRVDLAAHPGMTPLPWVFAETTEIVALDKGFARTPFRRYVRVDATPPTKVFYR